MQQRPLGAHGLVSSALGLGCMGMSEFYGTPDITGAIRTIHRALDLGVTLIDTADMYGRGANELLVGEALSGHHRERAIVATKCGIVRTDDPNVRAVNGRPDYVRASCEASMQRLGVDVIDLYQLHRVDPDVPIEESVGSMAELVHEGKVRWIGLSEAQASDVRRAAAVARISTLQSEYSVFERGIEGGVLDAIEELGIGLLAYSPLGRGMLTGTIRSADDLIAEDSRHHWPRFQEGNLAGNIALVDRLAEIAAEKGCTAGQLALAWLLARRPWVVPIPGTKRTRYLEENAAAADVALDATDLARIERAVPPSAVAGDRYPPQRMPTWTSAPAGDGG